MTFLLATADFPSLLSKIGMKFLNWMMSKKSCRIIEFGEIFHPTELFHFAQLVCHPTELLKFHPIELCDRLDRVYSF